jgi:hypothetical protein
LGAAPVDLRSAKRVVYECLFRCICKPQALKAAEAGRGERRTCEVRGNGAQVVGCIRMLTYADV